MMIRRLSSASRCEGASRERQRKTTRGPGYHSDAVPDSNSAECGVAPAQPRRAHRQLICAGLRVARELPPAALRSRRPRTRLVGICGFLLSTFIVCGACPPGTISCTARDACCWEGYELTFWAWLKSRRLHSEHGQHLLHSM